MAIPVDFNREPAPLQEQEDVGDFVLFDQNSTLFRVEKLGVQQLLMGLEQMPQPAVAWFRHLCCGIHSCQATTSILMGLALIPQDDGTCFTSRSSPGDNGLMDALGQFTQQAAVELG